MVPITNQNAALPVITAPRALQGRATTTVTNNATAMRVAAVHRVLSTLSVEVQAEIMNVYCDVVGWTSHMERIIAGVTRLEENALVDASTIRSLEADVEQLTAHMERLNTAITTSKETTSVDAANIRSLEADVKELTNNKEGLIIVIATSEEKASVDAAKIRSLEADVKELTGDKERLNLVIATSEERPSVDAAAIRSLQADVKELTADKERLTVGIIKLKEKATVDVAKIRPLKKAVRHYTIRHVVGIVFVGVGVMGIGIVFVGVGVMGIILATDGFHASINRKEDTIFRIVFVFTMMLCSSSKGLLFLLYIVALGFGFSLMIVGFMSTIKLVLTRSSSLPVPLSNTALVSKAIVSMTNYDASNMASPNGIGPKNATSDTASTKAKARKLNEIRYDVEVLVPAVIPEEADNIDEGSQELNYFVEKGAWAGVAAAAVKLSRR